MRFVLAIVVGVGLLAGVCAGQDRFAPAVVPSGNAAVVSGGVAGAAQAPAHEPDNVLLQEKLEEMRTQYGARDPLNGAGQEIVLKPRAGVRTFSISGDARAIYTQLATAFGVRATFDEPLLTKQAKYEIKDADFNAAMQLAALMTRTFWTAVAADQVLVAQDNPQKRRELERMLQKTFYLHGVSTPQELNDVVTMLRTLLEIRYITQQPANSAITVRAPQQTLHTAELLLNSLQMNRPQVMLQVQAFEVNQAKTRNVGVQLPLQFQIFSITSTVLDALNSPEVQAQLAQLIASGQLNATTIAGLLGISETQASALLSNSIATFGGGLTFFGITVPPVTANFSQTESRVKTLEEAMLRASQGNAATLHIGTRYPVLTSSFTPGFSAQNTNFNVVGATPGFNYEDLGLTLKAKPTVHGTSSVTLELEVDIRTLGAQRFNDVPVIQNRTYKGVITVDNGESAVVAGMVTRTESRALAGLPAVGRLPVFNRLTSNANRNDSESELIVVITPQVLVGTNEAAAPAIVVTE